MRDARAILTHVRSEADAQKVAAVGRSQTGLLPSFMMPTRPPTDAPEDEKITPRSRRNYARLRNSVSGSSRGSQVQLPGQHHGDRHDDDEEEDEDMAGFITAAMELEGHRERHMETAAQALRQAEERQDAQRRASRSASRRSNASDSSSRQSLILLQQQHAQAKAGSQVSSAVSLHAQPVEPVQPKKLLHEDGGRAEAPWQPRPIPQAPASYAAVPTDYTSRAYEDDRSAPVSPTALRQESSVARQQSWRPDVPQDSWRPAQQDKAPRAAQAPENDSYKASFPSALSSNGGTVRGAGRSDEASGEISRALDQMARQSVRAKEEGGYDEDFDNDFEDDFEEVEE